MASLEVNVPLRTAAAFTLCFSIKNYSAKSTGPYFYFDSFRLEVFSSPAGRRKATIAYEGLEDFLRVLKKIVGLVMGAATSSERKTLLLGPYTTSVSRIGEKTYPERNVDPTFPPLEGFENGRKEKGIVQRRCGLFQKLKHIFHLFYSDESLQRGNGRLERSI